MAITSIVKGIDRARLLKPQIALRQLQVFWNCEVPLSSALLHLLLRCLQLEKEKEKSELEDCFCTKSEMGSWKWEKERKGMYGGNARRWGHRWRQGGSGCETTWPSRKWVVLLQCERLEWEAWSRSTSLFPSPSMPLPCTSTSLCLSSFVNFIFLVWLHINTHQNLYIFELFLKGKKKIYIQNQF